MTTILAFDTGTERSSVALLAGGRVCSGDDLLGGPASSTASATLLPAIGTLLARAGVGIAALDAIAFGRGPGAFTGLRTAASVAQGLAFGAGKPVLPIDSLLAVAEEARDGRAAFRVWALLDARMGELYAAEYAHADGRWRTLVAPLLADPAALVARWRDAPPETIAGNGVALLPAGAAGAAATRADAIPTARALLRLAETAWRDGAAVDAASALPLYVRDKVADTEAERRAARAPRA